MRGHDEQTHHMFSYLSPEQRVPADHLLRAVRALTDHALKTMLRRFAGLYAMGHLLVSGRINLLGPSAVGKRGSDPTCLPTGARGHRRDALDPVRRPAIISSCLQ